MDTFFSAVLGDLLGRSISFIVDSYYQQHQGVEENLQKLHHVLLRIQAIVEEASSRHITNQAMLLQLTMLSNMMYRGYYFLDNFSWEQVPVGSGTSSLRAPPITSKTLAPYPAAPMASASAGGMAANAPDWRSTKPLPPLLPHPPPPQAVAVAGHTIADSSAGLSSRRHRAAAAGSGRRTAARRCRKPSPSQAVVVAGRARRCRKASPSLATGGSPNQ
ncbi:hypothetical protein OsI_03557 [Oryza sativa Indica Group]|uniref:Disease resistance N-terminal domain-containing protein n=1 Tax=Oryza sativa subsp. indica TaxID=39946 RepID=B8A8Q7_ORYSI|nr:hypothetical protein OsI_03557 [Oryza sativa Indica Group]